MVALGLSIFGTDLTSEPHFVDESAYISQSFFADLWVGGDWNNSAWLTYAGYDLPPLPKYVIGLALRTQGYRRPGPESMVAWYRNTSRQFVPKPALVAARCPSVVFGVLGCLATYAIGTMARDRRLGFVAAILLMANPLYAMHARRAMSDVYAESLILATAAVGLWSWTRLLRFDRWRIPFLALVAGSGILGGLATLSKLNGTLGGFFLGAWAMLAVLLLGFPGRRRARDRGGHGSGGCRLVRDLRGAQSVSVCSILRMRVVPKLRRSHNLASGIGLKSSATIGLASPARRRPVFPMMRC